MTFHALQRCVTRKVRMTLCGRRGNVISKSWRTGRMVCLDMKRGRFRVGGIGDVATCWQCAQVEKSAQ